MVLAIDLVGFNRKSHVVTIKEAATWSIVWVVLSLSFNALVWHLKGLREAIEFFTGYLIEYSLSVDNIFVFVLIFSYFQVPAKYQHRVLVLDIFRRSLPRISHWNFEAPKLCRTHVTQGANQGRGGLQAAEFVRG